MPDASHPFRDTAPLSWGDAFLALPAESPPAGGWASLERRLEGQRQRRHLPAWLGVAAAAALVAVVAWPRQEPVERVAASAAPTSRSPATGVEVAAPSAPAIALPAKPVVTQPPVDPPAPRAVATAATETPSRPEEPTRAAAGPGRLQLLQTESARLEALLAVARDDSFGSASALLLADAYDAQVAGIDAALSAPDLAPAEREHLWQARVDALQQAAGFEGTQRLLAAGGHDDALLVAVD